MTWIDVCALEQLSPNRGVAALVGGRQVAVFLIEPGGELVAVDNVDPASGSAVLSRGIVGSAGEVLTVASPVYKHRFDLRTGRCLDAPGVSVTTHPARLVEGRIQVEEP